MDWMDFNTAETKKEFALIPEGMAPRVRLNIKPGGYNDESQGWVGGYATKNENTGSVYLKVDYVVIDGDYRGIQIFDLIGLHSKKSPLFGGIGRAKIRAIIASSRIIADEDKSDQAISKRILKDLSELDGMEFTGIIGIKYDKFYNKQVNTLTPYIKPYDDKKKWAPPVSINKPPVQDTMASKFNDDIPF